jgi:hypothetical protein
MERRHKLAGLIGGVIVPVLYWAFAISPIGDLRHFLAISAIFFPLGVAASFVGGMFFLIAALINALMYVAAIELVWSIFKREKPLSIRR